MTVASTSTLVESPAVRYQRGVTTSALESAGEMIDKALEASKGKPSTAAAWTNFHLRSAASKLDRSAELMRGMNGMHGFGVDAITNAADSARVLAARHSTVAFSAVDATSDISWLQRSFSFDAGRALAMLHA